MSSAENSENVPLCTSGRMDGIVAHISRGSIFPPAHSSQLDGISEGEINVFRASEKGVHAKRFMILLSSAAAATSVCFMAADRLLPSNLLKNKSIYKKYK